MKNLLFFLLGSALLLSCGKGTDSKETGAVDTLAVATDTVAEYDGEYEGEEDHSTLVKWVDPDIEMYFNGSINKKYGITMTLTFYQGGIVSGFYRYFTQKDGITVNGNYDSLTGKFALTETISENREYKNTGFFEGIYKNKQIAGTWFNGDRTKQFPFEVNFVSPSPFARRYKLDYEGSVEDNGITVSSVHICDMDGVSMEALAGFTSFSRPGENLALSIADVNFDSWPDILLLAGDELTYNIWVYDPAKEEYYYLPESPIERPTVDFKAKQVISFGDVDDEHYFKEFRVFQDGHLYLVERSVYALAGGPSIKTSLYKIVDGKSVPVE